MNWTELSGGLVGFFAGALAGAGIAYAATDEGKHMTPAIVGGALGGIAAGLGGAKLGKVSQLNRWQAANLACGANMTADWATLQCVPFCPDDSVPVNGACSGFVPNGNLFGAGKTPEKLGG
jgi:hypothetical protein